MGYFDTPAGRNMNEPNEMVDMPSPTRGLPGYSSGLQGQPEILGSPMPNPEMKRGIMGTVQPQKPKYTPKQYGQQMQAQKRLRSGYPSGGIDALPQMGPRRGRPMGQPPGQGMPQAGGPEQQGMGQQWLGQLWSGSLEGGSGFAGGGPVGSDLAGMYQKAKASFSQGVGSMGQAPAPAPVPGGGLGSPMIERPAGGPQLPPTLPGAGGGPPPGGMSPPQGGGVHEELAMQKHMNQLLMEELERCMAGGGIPSAIPPQAQLALAGGGPVHPMQGASSQIAAQGRGGDDILVHMNRHELAGLESILGPTTVNPETGNPEALAWFIPIIAGMALGAAVGGATTKSWEGALMGGALGGVTGGIAGPLMGAGAAAAPAAAPALVGLGGTTASTALPATALPAAAAAPGLAGLGGTAGAGAVSAFPYVSAATGGGALPFLSGAAAPAAAAPAAAAAGLSGTQLAGLGMAGLSAAGSIGGGGASTGLPPKRKPGKAAPGSWIDRPGASGRSKLAGRGLTRPDYIG